MRSRVRGPGGDGGVRGPTTGSGPGGSEMRPQGQGGLLSGLIGGLEARDELTTSWTWSWGCSWTRATSWRRASLGTRAR